LGSSGLVHCRRNTHPSRDDAAGQSVSDVARKTLARLALTQPVLLQRQDWTLSPAARAFVTTSRTALGERSGRESSYGGGEDQNHSDWRIATHAPIV